MKNVFISFISVWIHPLGNTIPLSIQTFKIEIVQTSHQGNGNINSSGNVQINVYKSSKNSLKLFYGIKQVLSVTT